MFEIDGPVHALEADNSLLGEKIANAYVNMVDWATQPEPLTAFQQKWIDRFMEPALGGEKENEFMNRVMNEAGMVEVFNDTFDQAYMLLDEKMTEPSASSRVAS